MAITTPAQSTICILGLQAVPRLAIGLDSMWHTSTVGGSNQRRIIWFLFGFKLLVNVFSAVPLSVLPRVMASWGLNTRCQNIISKVFDRTTSKWSCSFLCRNCQLVPSMWAIMKNLARCTWNEHLNVKMVSIIKITAHPAKNKIVRHWKYQVGKNCHLLATASCHHNALTLDSALTGTAQCRHEQNRCWTN